MKAAVKIVCLLVIVEMLATSPGSHASQHARESSQVSTPEIFASGIVSTGKEFGLTFMPKGKEAIDLLKGD